LGEQGGQRFILAFKIVEHLKRLSSERLAARSSFVACKTLNSRPI
jgi:hypothetical protein